MEVMGNAKKKTQKNLDLKPQETKAAAQEQWILHNRKKYEHILLKKDVKNNQQRLTNISKMHAAKAVRTGLYSPTFAGDIQQVQNHHVNEQADLLEE